MSGDLYYFYECDLDKKNLSSFYHALPARLQKIFAASVRTGIVPLNVLQGYRGPSNMRNGGSGDSAVLHSSHGLQEIKHWWAMRKDINLMLPGLGSIIYGATRVTQKAAGDTEWSSLYFDSKTGECLSHKRDEAAKKLQEIGEKLYKEGNYAEAAEYFNNAYRACSSGYGLESTFKDDAARAEDEIKATSLNAEGDRLLGQGRYGEAADKYGEAYRKSHVSARYERYSAGREKARVELDAANLSLQADTLFEQGEYAEAAVKYQEARDKSQVEREKVKYSDKKCQCVNKWLDTLWRDAWDAEEDVASDRSEEAKEIFLTILRESQNSLREFPDDSKLKQYESLATLKIEGNEMFNQGVESQQHGVALFGEAQELQRQEKYEWAGAKFTEARNYFQAAFRKFEEGSRSDRRFVSCAEFVQDHINEVTRSIEITEQLVDDTFCEYDTTVRSRSYCAHT